MIEYGKTGFEIGARVMRDDDKIVVKLNNENIEANNRKVDSTYDWYKEQAATTDRQDNEIDELERRTPVYAMTNPKKKKNRYLKSILLTTSLAIIVGIGFGFGVLKMFVEIDKPSATVSTDQSIIVDDEEDSKKKSGAETSSITLPSISAFIVQAGMFSTEDKAGEWKGNLEQAEFSAFSWKSDDGVRLITSVHATKEKGEQMADKLAQSNFEGYVRQWSTEEQVIELTAEEGKWLQEFAPLFTEMVENISDEKALADKLVEWNNWIEAAPKEMPDALSSLKKTASTFSEVKTEQKRYEHLLSIWYQYDQL